MRLSVLWVWGNWVFCDLAGGNWVYCDWVRPKSNATKMPNQTSSNLLKFRGTNENLIGGTAKRRFGWSIKIDLCEFLLFASLWGILAGKFSPENLKILNLVRNLAANNLPESFYWNYSTWTIQMPLTISDKVCQLQTKSNNVLQCQRLPMSKNISQCLTGALTCFSVPISRASP